MATQHIIKKAIGEGTKDLMRQKTVNEISVTEICEKVGISRRNFYRYFQDKYEVVQWIYYHDSLMEVKHYADWTIWDHFPHITETLYNDRAFYCNAFRYRGQNSFRDYCLIYLKEFIAPDYRAAFHDEQALDFFIDHICNMTFDAFVNWLSEDPCLPPEAFAERFTTAFQKASAISVELLTRAPGSTEAPVAFEPDEPSKK